MRSSSISLVVASLLAAATAAPVAEAVQSPAPASVRSRAAGIRLTLFGDAMCTTYSYRIALDAGIDSCSPVPLADMLDMTAMRVTEFDAPGVQLSMYGTADCSDDPLDTIGPTQDGEFDRNTCVSLGQGVNQGRMAKAYRVFQNNPKGSSGTSVRSSAFSASVEDSNPAIESSSPTTTTTSPTSTSTPARSKPVKGPDVVLVRPGLSKE